MLFPGMYSNASNWSGRPETRSKILCNDIGSFGTSTFKLIPANSEFTLWNRMINHGG
jgi:hypothetical protein